LLGHYYVVMRQTSTPTLAKHISNGLRHIFANTVVAVVTCAALALVLGAMTVGAAKYIARSISDTTAPSPQPPQPERGNPVATEPPRAEHGLPQPMPASPSGNPAPLPQTPPSTPLLASSPTKLPSGPTIIQPADHYVPTIPVKPPKLPGNLPQAHSVLQDIQQQYLQASSVNQLYQAVVSEITTVAAGLPGLLSR
jgi:hypothetical protein